MFFLEKSNIGIFTTFLFELNLAHCARKKLSIYNENLLRFCRNLALR